MLQIYMFLLNHELLTFLFYKKQNVSFLALFSFAFTKTLTTLFKREDLHERFHAASC